jgi:hypothetical protein
MKTRLLLLSILVNFQTLSQIGLGFELQTRKVNGFNWFSSNESYKNPLNLQYIPTIKAFHTNDGFEFGIGLGFFQNRFRFDQITVESWFDAGMDGSSQNSVTTYTHSSTFTQNVVSNYFFIKEHLFKKQKWFIQFRIGSDVILSSKESDFNYHKQNVFDYTAPYVYPGTSFHSVYDSTNTFTFQGISSKKIVTNGLLSVGYENNFTNNLTYSFDIGIGAISRQLEFYKCSIYTDENNLNLGSSFQFVFNFGLNYSISKKRKNELHP